MVRPEFHEIVEIVGWTVSLKCKRTGQNVSKCLKIHQNVSKCVKMCQNVSKCLKIHQNVSKCVKMCQNVSKCLKIHQNVSKCVKMCQNVSKCVKIYQNVSKCVMSFLQACNMKPPCQASCDICLSGIQFMPPLVAQCPFRWVGSTYLAIAAAENLCGLREPCTALWKLRGFRT